MSKSKGNAVTDYADEFAAVEGVSRTDGVSTATAVLEIVDAASGDARVADNATTTQYDTAQRGNALSGAGNATGVDVAGTTTRVSAPAPETTLDELEALAAGFKAPRKSASPKRTKKAAVRSGSSRSAMTTSRWARRYCAVLRISDLLIIVATIALTQLALHPSVAAERFGDPTLLGQSAIMLVIWMSALALTRSRDKQTIGVGIAEYKAVFNAGLVTIGATAVVFLLMQAETPRGYVFAMIPIGTVLLLVSRWAARQWLTYRRKDGYFLSRVVVLGSKQDVEYVSERIVKKSGAVYQVVAAVIEDSDSVQLLRSGDKSIPVFTQLDNVRAVVERYNADSVIVAGQLSRGSSYVRELGWELERSNTELVVASSLTNVAGPRIRFRPVDGLPLMHVDLPSFSGSKHILKRTVDVVLASMALALAAIPMAIVALMVRLDSPGKALFRQVRVGRNGQPFTMYKFRSMVETAEQDLVELKEHSEGNGVLFKMKSDPRVTRVGKFIRKTSLDELPQIFNVLRGDMSLVGPRPPLPSEVASYHGYTHRRLFIKPGITGLWQVNGRSDLDWEESVRLDLYYVENWSLMGDLMIMWQTVKVMLNSKGAY